MDTTESEGIAARVRLNAALAVGVELNDGTLRAVFEWRQTPRPGRQGRGRTYRSWSFAYTPVTDHRNLTEAVYSLLADPPRRWLRLAGAHHTGAPWPRRAAELTDRLVTGLLSEIDRRVEAVFDPSALDDWLSTQDDNTN